MALVEHDQSELIAEPLHVDAGAVVSRDRHRVNSKDVVANDARIVAESLVDAAMPLVHQIANGGDDQRADREFGHDGECDLGLQAKLLRALQPPDNGGCDCRDLHLGEVGA